MTKPTAEQLKTLEEMANAANASFAAACRDPDITKEDYEKLRRQYEDAQRRHHRAWDY